jgi:ribose/xylose/arabinose/galactoside ABC-type transport system permease subunit
MMRRYRRELSVAFVYACLLVVLAVQAPRFYQGSQLGNILVQSAPVLVAAVGMTLVILARQIDISIGSQLSLCAVTAGLLARSGVPMPAVAAATMAVGAACGALNGFFIAGLGLPSIVVTLATMAVVKEGLRWWREGEFVRDLPADFQWFGLNRGVGPRQLSQDDTATTQILDTLTLGLGRGQWLILLSAFVVFLLFAWGMRYLAGGRAVYATGSDPEAARLAGIRPRRVVFVVFVLMGTLTGLAALLSAVCLPQVDPRQGEGFELQVIAAVVVGGVAVSGGRGTLIGPFFGVLLLGTIKSALVFLGTEAQWEKAIQGAIVLIAVGSDAIRLRQRKDRGAGVVVS